MYRSNLSSFYSHGRAKLCVTNHEQDTLVTGSEYISFGFTRWYYRKSNLSQFGYYTCDFTDNKPSSLIAVPNVYLVTKPITGRNPIKIIKHFELHIKSSPYILSQPILKLLSISIPNVRHIKSPFLLFQAIKHQSRQILVNRPGQHLHMHKCNTSEYLKIINSY